MRAHTRLQLFVILVRLSGFGAVAPTPTAAAPRPASSHPCCSTPANQRDARRDYKPSACYGASLFDGTCCHG
ncbi:hypothetical protein GQ53DRAFT_744813 [Thozetella sp. PMI_491]|nr:hypothetical protein GQ53DRAFT_744813 [Thozetella sp. PMI_491]